MGTPTIAGTYVFSLTASAGSQFATKQFTLTVNPQPGTPAMTSPLIVLTPSVLPNAQVGQPYSVNLEATGASGYYGWDIGGASFPISGLGLSKGNTNCSDAASFLCSNSPTSIIGTPGKLYVNGVQVSSLTFTLGFNVTSGPLSLFKPFTLTVVDPSPVSNTTIPPAPVIPPPTIARSCKASIYWGDSLYYPQTTVSYGGSAKETWSVQEADQVWADCGDGPKQISTGPQSYTFNNLVNNRTCKVWGVFGSNNLGYDQSPCHDSATIYVTNGNVMGAESFTFTERLQLGSIGNEVMQLQKFLNGAGYNSGNVDGNFGLQTQTALIKFEVAKKLTPDGIVGVQVRLALNNQ